MTDDEYRPTGQDITPEGWDFSVDKLNKVDTGLRKADNWISPLIGTGVTLEGWCSDLGSDHKPEDYTCAICGYIGPKTDGWYEFTESFNQRKYSVDRQVHSLSWVLCPDCGRGRYITPLIIDPEKIIYEEGYIKRRWGEEWPLKKEEDDEQ